MKTICGSTPIVTLQGGVLKDQNGRTGEIVANSQLQFDEPLQSGALFTSGFSICGNGSLAVGGSTVFYQCLSGSFYNLYQQSQGKQCNEVYINTIPCEANGSNPADTSSSSVPTAMTMTMGPGPATQAPSSAPTPATPATPITPTTSAAPYPVTGNSTAPGATGSGTGVIPTTSATTSPSPSSFKPGSGAATIVIGGKLVALVAAIGAFAMF